MKLLSKHIIVDKSYSTVYQIIKSSAYYVPKGSFFEKSFSMYYAKRFKGGIISLIPVKGTITQQDKGVEVMLTIHPNLGVYLGCFLCLIGILGLFWCYISNSSRWIPCVGSVLLGMLVGGQDIWESKDCLDTLERKLRN